MSVGNVDGGDWFEKSADHQVHKAEVKDFLPISCIEWLNGKYCERGSKNVIKSFESGAVFALHISSGDCCQQCS